MLFMTQKKLDRILAEEREKIYENERRDRQLAEIRENIDREFARINKLEAKFAMSRLERISNADEN